MARRGRGNRFEFCTQIAICMQTNFGFTYKEIGEVFGCSQSTVKKRLEEIGYKAPRASGRNKGNVAHNKQEQEACYERFMTYWYERGYSDKFEFLGGRTSSKGKVKLRCKLCGCEFERFGNIAQRNTNIRCANCWIHRDDETIAQRDYQLTQHLADAYSNSYTVANIAKAYNLDERVVSMLIKESGVVIDCNKAEYKKSCSRSRFKENDKRIRQEWRNLNNELSQWRRELKAISEIQSAKRTKQRLAKVAREIESMQVYEPQIATCKHCGKEWLFWPSREKYAHHKPPTFCSVRCYNNHHYRSEPDNHRHRAKKYGVAFESGITLDEIEKRDNCTCYLCGGKTNRNDRWITQNGFYGHGPTYPTQDHVTPMVRGGDHARHNIKLAHKRCNEIKGDKLLIELQLPFSIPKGALAS